MIVVYALFGLLVGAAINLLSDQLPRWRRVRSMPFCPACQTKRPARAGIAAIGYMTRAARCPACGARIPARHPLVELGTMALFAFLWHRYGAPGDYVLLLLYTVYSSILILVLVIDLEHKLILNVVMYPAWAVALLGSLIHPVPHFYRLAVIGGVTGFGILFLVYAMGELFVKAMSRARGKPVNAVAFGFGDVRLGAFLGLIVGFPYVLHAIFYAILLGGVVGMVYWLVHAVILRDYSLFTAIAYGPFLVTAGMAVLFLGSW